MKKLTIITLLTSCAVTLSSTAGVGPASNIAKANSKPIEVANFDKTVKPGDDFYQYVNGTWLKNNPIPPTETRWGSFGILDELTRTRVKTILDEIATNQTAAPGTAEQKIRDFYGTAMDSVKCEKLDRKSVV